MSRITTHVLDTALGRPAAGVPVLLERLVNGEAEPRVLGRGVTDTDGRLRDLAPPAPVLGTGIYRLRFDTGAYFRAQELEGFYPEVSVLFEVAEGREHYHVPLLLSPFGYSTYRGS
jgi:5-hydroxyisourate hydrolase